MVESLDISQIGNHLSELNLPDADYIRNTGSQIAEAIFKRQLVVLDLVKGLDPILTNFSHAIRSRGVDLLCHVITSLSRDKLSQKEIEVLSEFTCSRFVDHKSMESASLKLLSYFVDCENKPQRFNKTLMDFLSTKANVRRMDASTRGQVYELAKKIVIEKRQQSKTIDSDLIYSLVHMIEGESNPENLLLCFGLVSYVMKNFEDLEPFVDDLFEWLSSYYPIDYTPPENQAGINIARSDLVQALYDCFYSNEINSANLQTLLLEKLESNTLSTKLESLNCLIRCYQSFSLSSIKDYASSLWTAIRMECLKKISLVNTELMETSYRALSAMTAKLSEDGEIYFTFVSDIYEELSIAFKKPEMELFEPATRLLFNAARPKTQGINYILSKIMPLTIGALDMNELRPLPGLVYIFEELYEQNLETSLDSDLTKGLQRLFDYVVQNLTRNETTIRLLRALVRCKVAIDIEDSVIERLISQMQSSPSDIEELLALIAANYKKINILFEDQTDNIECNITSLFQYIKFYSDRTTVTSKFSIYLRLLIILADSSDQGVLSQLNENQLLHFFTEIRALAVTRGPNQERIADLIGRLHAIIINKIDNQRAEALVLSFFKSSYCQNLVPKNDEQKFLESCRIHLLLIRWVLKALALRNHHFTAPLINLILNFITSNDVRDVKLVLEGAQVFGFILAEDSSFDRKKGYNIFALYKQKFYSQTNKEIRTRLGHSTKNKLQSHILLCALAIQIPNVPHSVYKRDHEWLVRELMKLLSQSIRDSPSDALNIDEGLISILFECLNALIINDTSDSLSGITESLVDLNLKYAREAATFTVRKLALMGLKNMATTLKESELLPLRSIVVERLKPCLADKKRFVRAAAAVTRMKWTLLGQPIGS